MAKATVRTRLEQLLEAEDFKLDPKSKAGRYHVYIHPRHPDRRCYLGRLGALRVGRSLVNSVSLTYLVDRLLDGRLSVREAL